MNELNINVVAVNKIKDLTRSKVEDLLESVGFDVKSFKGIKIGVIINKMFDVSYATKRAKNGRLIEYRAYILKDFDVSDIDTIKVDMLTNDTYKLTNVAYFNTYIKPTLPSDAERKVAKDLMNVTYRENHKKELK